MSKEIKSYKDLAAWHHILEIRTNPQIPCLITSSSGPMEKKLGADAAATGTACLAGTATVKKTTDKLSKVQLFIVKEYKSNFYKVKNTKLIIL